MQRKHPVTRDLIHTTLSVLCLGMLLAASFWIMRPFLLSLVWAALIVVATWPLLEKLQTWFAGRRGPAVVLMSLALLLLVLVPVAFAVLTIVDNAGSIAAHVKSLALFTIPAPPEWLKHIPLAGPGLAERWKSFAAISSEELAALLTPYAQRALQWFITKAGNIGLTMLQFLLTVIIAAILYAHGENAAKGALSFASRLARDRGEELMMLAARAIRGVVLGVVLTAFTQTVVGGIGLFIADVPAAPLLMAVMFMFCLAQIGPLLVLLPAVIWVYWSGKVILGTVLLVLTIIAGTVDGFLRPVLIKKGADLPLLLIFAGVIGGLIAFGVIGLFIGPVVLAVTYTLLKAWVDEGLLQGAVAHPRDRQDSGEG